MSYMKDQVSGRAEAAGQRQQSAKRRLDRFGIWKLGREPEAIIAGGHSAAALCFTIWHPLTTMWGVASSLAQFSSNPLVIIYFWLWWFPGMTPARLLSLSPLQGQQWVWWARSPASIVKGQQFHPPTEHQLLCAKLSPLLGMVGEPRLSILWVSIQGLCMKQLNWLLPVFYCFPT